MIVLAALLTVGLSGVARAATAPTFNPNAVEFQSLDGSGNNKAHPQWGQVGQAYTRVTKADYADGISTLKAAPNTRMVSNRIFQDNSANVFSSRGVTQWGWQWGQFMDHVFGLADGGTEVANDPVNAHDPLEKFRNDFGALQFTRDKVAPGTGTSTSNPRQATNTVSSYIDAFNIYGGTQQRLEWLRDGPLDNNMANNKATLMLPGGFLPSADARGDASTAPTMAVDGRLRANPAKAAISGDVRANENLSLTATHTLFAREHNRIVSKLPSILSDEAKFQIARKVVIAEEQFVTFNQWLPTMGINLPAYTGYKPTVNTELSTEFATVGYRAHSQVHGEFEFDADPGQFTQAQLDAFEAQGVEVNPPDDEGKIAMAIPLNVAFFNPQLLHGIGLEPIFKSLEEAQYNNDEMIDNHLRTILFQVPNNGSHDCQEPVDPACFTGMQDLGALDVLRERDHGVPNYNDLRAAYGLPRKTSFTAITGESTDAFPAGIDVNNPASIDFTSFNDKNGAPMALDSPGIGNEPVSKTRVSTLAARLKAIYGSVDNVGAFVGMVSEKHTQGEFGELQAAIWTKQFQALRDGDRFFFGNDPVLAQIRSAFGIDFHRNLGDIIADNTTIPRSELRPNVFKVPSTEPLEPNRILNVNSKFCMDIPFSNAVNLQQLQLFACNQTDAQNWQQLPASGAIASVLNNKCLDVFNHGRAPGSAVGVFDCNGGTNQVFKFNGDGTIVGQESGLCLSVVRNSRSQNARLEMQTCDNRSSQKWIR